MTPLLLVAGLVAGILTTIAGQGGGLLLLLGMTALRGPHEALAITAPALLFGNLHRAILLRAHLDRAVARRMITGALPGALVGGLLTGVIPPGVLRLLLVVVTTLAIVKAIGWLRFQVPKNVLGPAGLLIGLMTGTAGGAGVLFAPVLLSVGLTGPTYIATTSTVAVAAHIGRVVGYAGLGLFSKSLLVPTVIVTSSIFAGNAVGSLLHARLSARRSTFIEYGALIVCAVLSVTGLG